MNFFRCLRLAAVWACLCASCILPVSAQQQQQTPPTQPPPTQPPQTPPRTNPFETVPREERAPSNPPGTPQVQRPQMEAPKQPEAPSVPPGTQVIEAIEFRGARRVPQDTLKQLIMTKQGDYYNEEAVR